MMVIHNYAELEAYRASRKQAARIILAQAACAEKGQPVAVSFSPEGFEALVRSGILKGMRRSQRNPFMGRKKSYVVAHAGQEFWPVSV